MTLTTSYQLLDESYLGNNGYGNVYIRLYGKYDSQSIVNNTTNVSFQARLYSGATWWASSGTYYNLTVNGSSTGNVSCNTSSSSMWPSGEATLGTKTVPIPHNDDGTKSISGSALFNSSPWGWNNTASKTVDLPTIPRTSKLNSASISISSNGGTVTITPSITKYASSFYDCLYIYNGNTQIAYWNGVSSGSVCTFSSGERTNLWNAMGTSKSISLSVYVCTYINSNKTTLVGTSNTVSSTAKLPTYSLSVSASVQDSISTYNTYKPNNSTYISYLSKPKFTFSASSSTGSTYGRSISYSVGGTGATSPYTVNNYTGGTYTVVASDGRESNSSTPSMTNVPYFKPTINASVIRPTATGSTVNISISGQYYSGTNLTNLLTPTATITYTEEGGTQQTESITLSSSTNGNTTSYSGSLTLNDMDYQKSIVWSITVSDKLGVTATSGDTLTRGLPVWSAYRENNRNNFVVNGELKEPNLDAFNDTSGTDWIDMMKNKINWCISNITSSTGYKETFINGGWSGVEYGFGLFSKINNLCYQLVWFSTRGIFYMRKIGTEYNYGRSDLTLSDVVYDTGSYNGNLNDLKTTRFVYANSSASNKPVSTNGYVESQRCDGSNYTLQRYTPVSNSGICYERQCVGGTWNSWKPVYSNGVIEDYGNSGMWHYRKWSDGYAELWGTTSVLSFNVTTAWGSVYESPELSGNVSNFPFSFTQQPHVSISVVDSNMNILSIEQGSPAVNKVSQIFVTRPDSRTGFTCKLYLYITGKWK